MAILESDLLKTLSLSGEIASKKQLTNQNQPRDAEHKNLFTKENQDCSGGWISLLGLGSISLVPVLSIWMLPMEPPPGHCPRRPCPRARLSCFPKPSVTVCRLSFLCSDPGIHQSRSCSSASWQSNSSSLQQISAELRCCCSC